MVPVVPPRWQLLPALVLGLALTLAPPLVSELVLA